MDEPVPEHVLAACMYFDLRPVGGLHDLGRELRALLREEAPRRRHFLSALARDVVERPVPLTVLGRVATERRGPRRGTVDLKSAGGLHLVGAGRVHALDLGLDATGTAARLGAAAAASLLPADVAGAAGEAHEHLLRLRLRHQLAQAAEGAALDNRVAPAELSRHEAVLLREALRTVGEVQEHLRDRYRTDLLG
jgi:CBS domain-containing protein